MSLRNLEHLFSPKSVALIGASDRPHSVGATVWTNLSSGYAVQGDPKLMANDLIEFVYISLAQPHGQAELMHAASGTAGFQRADINRRGRRHYRHGLAH